jgi:hypothetical protein
MHCYYHQDKEAVGSCKSCYKGLCSECAVDVGAGLACRGQCEERVRACNALVDRGIKLSPQREKILESNRKSLESSRKITSNAAIFNLVTGAVFIGWGLFHLERLLFLVILGVCFFVYGIIGLYQARKSAKERQEK